ncbi:MAG TPA: VOC family protein [Candidatus Kapabacteria bacterium]|jgi:predicted enzyme related to lactoylglutathione lyase|nr:VOC family protein [Candidatus Kapabacteria bacterium]
MKPTQTSLQAFRPHISLNVSDLAQSVEFYSALFGQHPAKERPGYAKFSLTDPPLNFSMNERPGAMAGGALSHLGFEVLSTKEVLDAQERLEASGIAVRAELPCERKWARPAATPSKIKCGSATPMEMPGKFSSSRMPMLPVAAPVMVAACQCSVK